MGRSLPQTETAFTSIKTSSSLIFGSGTSRISTRPFPFPYFTTAFIFPPNGSAPIYWGRFKGDHSFTLHFSIFKSPAKSLPLSEGQQPLHHVPIKKMQFPMPPAVPAYRGIQVFLFPSSRFQDIPKFLWPSLRS